MDISIKQLYPSSIWLSEAEAGGKGKHMGMSSLVEKIDLGVNRTIICSTWLMDAISFRKRAGVQICPFLWLMCAWILTDYSTAWIECILSVVENLMGAPGTPARGTPTPTAPYHIFQWAKSSSMRGVDTCWRILWRCLKRWDYYGIISRSID